MKIESTQQNTPHITSRAWAGNDDETIELDIAHHNTCDSPFLDVLERGAQVIVLARKHTDDLTTPFKRVKVEIELMLQDMNKSNAYYGVAVTDHANENVISKIGPIYPQNIAEIVGCYQE